MDHHEETIRSFSTRIAEDPSYVALVVVGSVARGEERSDSDVDVYLVASEAEFELAREEDRLSFVTSEDATYEGGYIDVKVASIEYLRRALAAADEPARASFVGARVVWTRDPEVEHLVRAIPEVDEEEYVQRARSYIAQTRLYGYYFLNQAFEREEPFLLHHAATHLVFAAGRALLAHNRRLFQGPKYLRKTIAELPHKPDGIDDLLLTVLETPSPSSAQALQIALESFHDWQVGVDETLSMFVEENELAWLTGTAPPEYR